MSKITLCYITCRKNNLIEWFLDSLEINLRSCLACGKINEYEVVIVSPYLKPEKYSQIYKEEYGDKSRTVWSYDIQVVSPLPSLVQGDCKVTKENWFSAANARNAGLIHSTGDYIMYIDDLSILSPTWLQAVIEAANEGYVLQGAYRKDKKVVVENGVLISSEPDGIDSRWNQCGDSKQHGHSSWTYGCSIGIPVELLLKVNGWDCLTDTIGYEDTLMGIMLQKQGARFVYDKRALTIESSEHHFLEGNYYRREDPATTRENYFEILNRFGVTMSLYPSIKRYDSSHAMIDLSKQKNQAVLNNFNVRELRSKVQNGEQVTLADMNYPDRHWFTGELLSDLK